MKKRNTDAFVAFTSVVNDYDLDQMQYDALWDLLSDNPLLPAHNIASRNKALKTSKQNVIGAINELLAKIQNQDSTITNFETKLNTVIGDIAATDSESWEILRSIDTNVVRAVVKIWLELGGAENDLDISDIGSSIKEAVRNLNDRLNGHEERITNLEKKLDMRSEEKVHEEPTLDPEHANTIILSKTPNEKRVILVVNGIEYDEGDDFTVNRELKQIIWNSEKSFDLEAEDELDVEYFIFS